MFKEVKAEQRLLQLISVEIINLLRFLCLFSKATWASCWMKGKPHLPQASLFLPQEDELVNLFRRGLDWTSGWISWLKERSNIWTACKLLPKNAIMGKVGSEHQQSFRPTSWLEHTSKECAQKSFGISLVRETPPPLQATWSSAQPTAQ